MLIEALAIVGVASIFIMWACDSFEEAADYLGRNMAPGIKGATINAIGSSLPEMMTAIFLLFLFNDVGGFSAGIATTAGSAVFNAVVIPMVCIFAVKYGGVKTTTGTEYVHEISLNKPNLARDGAFLIGAEILLIVLLGGTTLTWISGAVMVVYYLIYLRSLLKTPGIDDEEPEDDDDEDDEDEPKNFIMDLIKCKFNKVFFNDAPLNDSNAWVVLTASVVVISAACYGLSEAVIMSAEALSVPAYVTAILLAAAATSVPDTILSVKDAKKGNYDDAISNAVGSNTFDITVALGIPLILYSIFHGGSILIDSVEDIQVLRVVLIGVTLAVLASMLMPRKITVMNAYFFLATYLTWMGYILYTAFV